MAKAFEFIPEIKNHPSKGLPKGEMEKSEVDKIVTWHNTDPSAFETMVKPKEKKEEKKKPQPVLQPIKTEVSYSSQKSANIGEPKKEDNFYVKPFTHTRTRQELIKSGRKKTRRVQRNIKSREPEMYEAVFER